MEFAHGGAHLIVRVLADVFHQEVHQAGIALQDAEELQGAIRGRPGWRGRRRNLRRRRRALRQTEVRNQFRGKLTAEQKGEKTSKCQADLQMNSSKN